MIKYFKITAAFLMVLIPFLGLAEKKIKFVAGFKGGTYESIAQSLKETGILDADIVNSQGSEEIIDIVNKGSAEFGIAQIDILLNAYNNKEWSVKNVQFVLPLYAEEVHVIAKKEIKAIDELSGRSISIGDMGSGTSGTSLILLKNIGIRKSISDEFLYLPTKNGLDALKKGDIEALFIVSGVPVELLKELPAEFSKKFNLIELGDAAYKKITESLYHYRQTVIPKRSYKWLEENIKTVAVVSTIIANKDVPRARVSDLIKSIYANRKKLEARHSKWRELNSDTIKWYLGGRTDRFHPGAVEALMPVVKD